MNRIAIVVGVVVAAIVGIAVYAMYASGKADGAGLFGPGILSAEVNLVLEAVLVLGLTFGFYLARTGKIEAHRVNQTTWVLVNAVLVALIMAPSIQQAGVDNLSQLGEARIALAWLHAAIGTFAVVSGLWLLLQMNGLLPRNLHITWWKNLMRATLAAYWAVALLGVGLYKFWYVG
jgi:hypothetical protein